MNCETEKYQESIFKNRRQLRIYRTRVANEVCYDYYKNGLINSTGSNAKWRNNIFSRIYLVREGVGNMLYHKKVKIIFKMGTPNIKSNSIKIVACYP